MAVILVRHADPEDDSARGDAGRVLTALGREQARDTAAWLAGFVEKLPARILTSPLARTLQTAEVLVATWGSGAVVPANVLRPGQSLAAATALAQDEIALVGHQPMMGELAAALLKRSSLPFSFERAAALVLDVSPAGFRFRAYRVPFGEPVLSL